MNIDNLVFQLGDIVSMRVNNEIIGTINAVLVTDSGIEYRVIVWDEMCRKQEWMTGCEIKKI